MGLGVFLKRLLVEGPEGFLFRADLALRLRFANNEPVTHRPLRDE